MLTKEGNYTSAEAFAERALSIAPIGTTQFALAQIQHASTLIHQDRVVENKIEIFHNIGHIISKLDYNTPMSGEAFHNDDIVDFVGVGLDLMYEFSTHPLSDEKLSFLKDILVMTEFQELSTHSRFTQARLRDIQSIQYDTNVALSIRNELDSLEVYLRNYFNTSKKNDQISKPTLYNIISKIAKFETNLADTKPLVKKDFYLLSDNLTAAFSWMEAGEALVRYAYSGTSLHIFIVSSHGQSVYWTKTNVSEVLIAELIYRVRCGLDRSMWNKSAPQADQTLETLSCSDFYNREVHESAPLPIDLKAHIDLYSLLISPIEDRLEQYQIGKVNFVLPAMLEPLPLEVLIQQSDYSAFVAEPNANFLSNALWLGSKIEMMYFSDIAGFILSKKHTADYYLENLAPEYDLLRKTEPLTYFGIGAPDLVGNANCPRYNASPNQCPVGRLDDVDELVPAAPSSVVSRNTDWLVSTAVAEGGGVRSLCPLPGAKAELLCAEQMVRFHGGQVVSKIGKNANEGEYGSAHMHFNQRELDVLHVATHALTWNETDLFGLGTLEAAFVLTPTGNGLMSDADGLLSIREIIESTVSARTVILSGCQTGDRDRNSRGVRTSLPEAFFSKGARFVVASMWDVHDTAASILIGGMLAGMMEDRGNASESLWVQKRKMIRSRSWISHPEFWASYVVLRQ
ncbi:MAG: CHAT domain-containing protein [Pseudomonadota bacterium]